MITKKVKTALAMLEVWYEAKTKSEHYERVERFNFLKPKWRRNQIYFKVKGLIAHDRHLTEYPRGYDCE